VEVAERHIRNILGGVIFREPIICRNVPGSCRAGRSRSSSAATPIGDQYRATDFKVPGKGR
jgi:isocitrate dehydrogenase